MFHKCSSQPMWVLSVWDKSANCFLAGLAIPDVSGICPAAVKLLFSGWFVGSSDVSREFRQSGVPAWVGSSDVSHFNWLGGFTVLVIPDVSDMHDQRPTASFQKPWGSGVLTWVGSSDTSYSLTQLLGFQICWGSRVPTWVGSSDGWEFQRLTTSL